MVLLAVTELFNFNFKEPLQDLKITLYANFHNKSRGQIQLSGC
jgi:hypothetical protein